MKKYYQNRKSPVLVFVTIHCHTQFLDLCSQNWTIYIPKLGQEESVFFVTSVIKRMTEESPFLCFRGFLKVAFSIRIITFSFIIIRQKPFRCQVIFLDVCALTQIRIVSWSGLRKSRLSKIIYMCIPGNDYF